MDLNYLAAPTPPTIAESIHNQKAALAISEVRALRCTDPQEAREHWKMCALIAHTIGELYLLDGSSEGLALAKLAQQCAMEFEQSA